MEVLTRGGGDGITNVERSSRVITIQSKHRNPPPPFLRRYMVKLFTLLKETNLAENHTFFGGNRTYPFEKNKRVLPRVLNNSNINFNSLL